MTTPNDRSPFLAVQRTFPEISQHLSVELSKAYVDIAQNVNKRTIGTFSKSPVVTGNNWFLTGGNNRQQTLRQVYTFTAAGNIAHGVNTTQIVGFVQIYGTFTNGTNWYPLPYVDVVAANNQVNVIVTPTNIVITSGAGAPPAITSGFCVLEWLSNV